MAGIRWRGSDNGDKTAGKTGDRRDDRNKLAGIRQQGKAG